MADMDPLSTPQNIQISDVTCDSFRITWEMTPEDVARVTHYFIVLRRREGQDQNRFKHRDVPTKLVAKASALPMAVRGHWFLSPQTEYRLSVQTAVRLADGDYHTSDCSQVVEFCTGDYAMEHLAQLLGKAQGHAGRMLCFSVFYRDQQPEYFSYVREECGGVMRPCLRNSSGSHGSPINAKLRGVFLSCNTELHTGLPPGDSPYGPLRLQLPAAHILNPNMRLYFADFYCVYTAHHYVTLVLTPAGSEGDGFCQGRLPPLDPTANPFLTYAPPLRQGEEPAFRHAGGVILEVLFTEPLSLEQGSVGPVAVGPGVGLTAANAKKDPSCKVCNIGVGR